MITLNPINNSNNHINTFKAKINNQQIYKQMAELTVKKEDKILPKVLKGDNLQKVGDNTKKTGKLILDIAKTAFMGVFSLPLAILGMAFDGDDWKENLTRGIGYLAIAAPLICLMPKSKDNDLKENVVSEQKIETKVDSLNNSYKGKNISVEEF